MQKSHRSPGNSRRTLALVGLRAPHKTLRRRPADTRRAPALLGFNVHSHAFHPRALARWRLLGKLGPVWFGALTQSSIAIPCAGSLVPISSAAARVCAVNDGLPFTSRRSLPEAIFEFKQ